MERAEYLKKENWHGSFYEVALELGPRGDDALAERALKTLWRQTQLRGPWRDRARFSADPDDIIVGNEQVALYGCLAFDDLTDVGCTSYLVREAEGADWLDLSIPVSMLELRFNVSYPLDRVTNPWLADVDRALVGIAAAVYAEAPFRLGLIGEEASGALSADELSAEMCKRGGVLVPDEVWRKMEPNSRAERVSAGLTYVPFLGPHITYGG